jgi:hypothetical protein
VVGSESFKEIVSHLFDNELNTALEHYLGSVKIKYMEMQIL